MILYVNRPVAETGVERAVTCVPAPLSLHTRVPGVGAHVVTLVPVAPDAWSPVSLHFGSWMGSKPPGAAGGEAAELPCSLTPDAGLGYRVMMIFDFS